MAKCPEQDCSESDGELGISVSLTSPLMNCLPMAIILALTKRGVMSMPRKLPPHVERNHVKGHTYLSFRRGKGPRVRLPKDPTSEEFMAAYQAALLGQSAPVRDRLVPAQPGSIAALIASYMRSAEYIGLRDTSKTGYTSRLEMLRTEHGHRTVAGLSRERIVTGILQPYADRPGAALDTLKKLRILILHAHHARTQNQDKATEDRA
jgi:enterobacteria phage integrase